MHFKFTVNPLLYKYYDRALRPLLNLTASQQQAADFYFKQPLSWEFQTMAATMAIRHRMTLIHHQVHMLQHQVHPHL